MKKLLFLPLLAALMFAGCAGENSPTETAQVEDSQVETAQVAEPTSAPVQLTATEELAKYCRVCVVDDGEKMEEFLPARLDKKVDGQTYRFCKDDCREKFDAQPAKYTLAKQ